MSLIITDESLVIEVRNSEVRIGYFTVNRMGFFENGKPRFSANLYLEYSKEGDIYFRKDISIDELNIDELNFETFYTRMKDREEFIGAEDKIPVYTAPIEIEILTEL